MSRKRARRATVNPFKQKSAVKRPGEPQLGMLVIHQIPGSGFTPTDLAIELDRDWFRSHPYRAHWTCPGFVEG